MNYLFRMSADFHALAQNALALEPADRLRLAAELIDSVEGVDPEWSSTWTDELHERTARAEDREARGEARGADWEHVRRRLLRDAAER